MLCGSEGVDISLFEPMLEGSPAPCPAFSILFLFTLAVLTIPSLALIRGVGKPRSVLMMATITILYVSPFPTPHISSVCAYTVIHHSSGHSALAPLIDRL